MGISIVIPALDEVGVLPALLHDLQGLRAAGAELVVCDGGSTDGTRDLAQQLCDRLVVGPPGRALQLNAGAAAARGDPLVFLHADSRVPGPAAALLGALCADDGWGFFPVRLDGESRLLPVVAAAMNLRSRLSGIGTGDQGLIVSRRLFDAVGGFPLQPLMEDIELCRRLRARRWPDVAASAIRSSGRRWDREGALRTILLMWRLRLRYFLGADPARLAREYHGG